MKQQAITNKTSRPREYAGARACESPVLNVLIACEESQAETTAFRELGHKAFSCDLQPCRPKGKPEWHIQSDARPFLQGQTNFMTQDGQIQSVPGWDLIIAHPPCTYLCKLGAQHLYKEPNMYSTQLHKWVNAARWEAMCEGRDFFYECLIAKAPFVAVENPLPMKCAQLPAPSCYADPSWFGVKYTKKTLYWLKNLPPIFAENMYPNPKSFVRSSRGKYRSRTFPQMAKAIARQWSNYILDNYGKEY